MSTKKTEAVAVIDETSYPVLREDAAEFLTEMLAPIGMAEIPKMKVPSGGGSAWEVPGLGGEADVSKSVDVVIGLLLAKQRTYWGRDFEDSEGGPAACRSSDGVTGIGSPGGECKVCPKAQWAEEKGGPPPECSEGATAFFFLPGAALPTVLRIPQQSLQAMKAYCFELASQRVLYSQVVTRLGLTKEPRKTGSGDFSKVTFNFVAHVPAPAGVKKALEAFALSL